MKREAKIAGAGPLADYQVGQRVMTREGYPGTVNDILEGPSDLTTLWVTLDGGLGGGEYAEAEVQPLSEPVTAGRIDASIEHTASDDYPELGSILTDRLPPQITTRTASLYDPAAHDALAARLALYLPPVPRAEQRASTTDIPESQRSGFQEGFAHGQEGITRDPSEPLDDDFRIGYDLGFSEGVTVHREPVNSWDIDELGQDQRADTPAGIPPTTFGATTAAIEVEGGALRDWVKDNGQPGSTYSYDWCRFRRNSHCWLPKDLNEAASQVAGYAVWVPEDRGNCWRVPWTSQQKCPTGMPGPHAGTGGFTDATIPWEEGGQRGGVPGNEAGGAASFTQVEDPTAPVHASISMTGAMEFTASWRDIQAKARRIRTEGGVRIVASRDNVIVGHIRGEHGVYETEIISSPGRRNTAAWHCGCKWASYSWGRSGPWKRFEGRMCSHALALTFEAQSRGSHGRTLTLDEKQPAWMDGQPIRQSGDYDRDKQRYSSLRPVEAQADDEVPTTIMATAMLTEGRRYAEVRSMLSEAGVEAPARVVASVRHKAFMARVDGDFVDVEIIGGQFVGPNGDPVDTTQMQHPKWHPTMGLNPDEQKVLTTGSVKQGSGTDLRAAARAMLEMARRNEPDTTTILAAEALTHNGEMAGLDHRFKSESSLLRKMQAEIHEYNGDAGRCAYNMSDTLRYTMLFPLSSYTSSMTAVLADLATAGYRERVKNFWQRGDAYNGVNVALYTPRGHPFELQFHTPESLDMKESKVHPLYERWRTESNPKTKADLSFKMRDLFDSIPQPPGVLSVPTLKMQPMPADHPHGEQMADQERTVSNAPNWVGATLKQLAFAQPPQDKYLMLHDNGGRPTTVARLTGGAVVEVWKEGAWVVDDHYGRYFFLGSTRTEEITEAQATAFTQGKTAGLHIASDEETPSVSGVALLAADTGRVLMLQRGMDDEDDPARGTWEFPGGHHEPGDTTSLHAGIREWEEEVGQAFPEGGTVAHTWSSPNGIYQGHVVVIPEEKAVVLHGGRSKDNPDDPGGDKSEQAAWWDPEHAKKNPALRPECKDSPWSQMKVLAPKTSAYVTLDQILSGEPLDLQVVSLDGSTQSLGEWLGARDIGGPDSCGACGGTGEQPSGHECYICEASGERSAEIQGRAAGIDNSNPENELPVGFDLHLHDQPTKEGSKMDIPDEFGSLFDDAASGISRTAAEQQQVLSDWGLEPSYDFQDVSPFAAPGVNHAGVWPPRTMMPGWDEPVVPVTPEDPEPALPATTGDESPERLAARLTAALAPRAPQSPTSGPRAAHAAASGGAGGGLAESDEERGRRLLAYVDASLSGQEVGGPNPFAHLAAGQSDNEIAASAANFLATKGQGIQTEALKQYNALERQAIIDEGQEVLASNLDRLDIKGTHYEALEATAGRSTPEDEDMTFLDGDPNPMD